MQAQRVKASQKFLPIKKLQLKKGPSILSQTLAFKPEPDSSCSVSDDSSALRDSRVLSVFNLKLSNESSKDINMRDEQPSAKADKLPVFSNEPKNARTFDEIFLLPKAPAESPSSSFKRF